MNYRVYVIGGLAGFYLFAWMATSMLKLTGVDLWMVRGFLAMVGVSGFGIVYWWQSRRERQKQAAAAGQEGLDGEPDALGLEVHGQHLHPHGLAHGQGIGGVLHILVGEFRKVDQPVLMPAHVHEGAEVRHVGDDPLEFHAHFQVGGLVDPFLEDHGLEALAGIPAGLLELGDDVLDGLHAEPLVDEEGGIQAVQDGVVAHQLQHRLAVAFPGEDGEAFDGGHVLRKARLLEFGVEVANVARVKLHALRAARIRSCSFSRSPSRSWATAVVRLRVRSSTTCSRCSMVEMPLAICQCQSCHCSSVTSL